MRARCLPGNKQAKDYFERGISVCERWQSYANFLADMGRAPLGTSLDRIDNDKGYSPDNCRWADSGTQRRNSRRVNPVSINGEAMLVADAAAVLGVTPSAVYAEVSRRGVSCQEAVDLIASRRPR